MLSTGRHTAIPRASRCCSREASFPSCTTSGFASGGESSADCGMRSAEFDLEGWSHTKEVRHEAGFVRAAYARGRRAAAGAVALVPPTKPRRDLGARRRRGAVQLRAPLLRDPGPAEVWWAVQERLRL